MEVSARGLLSYQQNVPRLPRTATTAPARAKPVLAVTVILLVQAQRPPKQDSEDRQGDQQADSLSSTPAVAKTQTLGNLVEK
jgi:hypothetical protein